MGACFAILCLTKYVCDDDREFCSVLNGRSVFACKNLSGSCFNAHDGGYIFVLNYKLNNKNVQMFLPGHSTCTYNGNIATNFYASKAFKALQNRGYFFLGVTTYSFLKR